MFNLNKNFEKIIDFMEFTKFTQVQYEKAANKEIKHKEMIDYFITDDSIKIDCNRMCVAFTKYEVSFIKQICNALVITLKNRDKIILYSGDDKAEVMHLT